MCSSQTAVLNFMLCFWAKGKITKQPKRASPKETAEYWDRSDAYLQEAKSRTLVHFLMLTKFDWGVDSNERLCYNTGILFLFLFCLSRRNVEIRFWQRWLAGVKTQSGWDCCPGSNCCNSIMSYFKQYIDLAKPKSGADFFFPARLKGTTPCSGQD